MTAHLTAQGVRASGQALPGPGQALEPQGKPGGIHDHPGHCARPISEAAHDQSQGEKRQEPPGHPTGVEDETRLPRQRMAPAMKLGRRGQRQLEVPT